MNRFLLPLVILCLFSSQIIEAKLAHWQWMRNGQVTGQYQVARSATDMDGNFYFTGYFRDSLQLGTTLLKAGGKNNLFVAKYNSAGSFQWLVAIEDSIGMWGAIRSRVYDIAADSKGGVYITGSFTDSIVIGTKKLISIGQKDMFLARFDKDGNVDWVKNAGGDHDDFGSGLAVRNDVIYLTGRFSAPGFFDNTILNATASGDIFVATYDVQGNMLSARGMGGAGQKYPYGIAVDDAYNIYLAGVFNATNVFFDNMQLANMNIGTIDGSAFIVKCDTSLNVDWAKTFRAENGGGSSWGSVYVDRVFAQSDSVIYMTGTFDGCDLKIGVGIALQNYGMDYFAIRYDNVGKALWAKNMKSDRFNYMRNAAMDGQGNLYLMGAFYSLSVFGTDTLIGDAGNDAVVGKYDKAGKLQWLATATGSGGEMCYSVSSTHSGDVFVTGVTTSPALRYNQDSLSKTGSSMNIFVGRIDPFALSVQAVVAASQSKVYPNPATDILTIEGAGQGTRYSIYNAVGQQVLGGQTNNTQEILDMSFLTPGFYTLQLTAEDGSKEIVKLQKL